MCSLGMTKDGSTWWVQVVGSLTREDLRQLAVLAGRLGTQPPSRVLLDFSRVRHLDFRGGHFLLATFRLVRLRGGDIQVTGVSGYVWNLLRLGVAQEADELVTSPGDTTAALTSPRARPPESLPRECPTMLGHGAQVNLPRPSPN